MKIYRFFLFLLLLSAPAFSQTDVKPKLAPLTKKYLAELKKGSSPSKIQDGYVYKRLADGNLCISAMIKVAEESSVNQKLIAAGITVGTKAGSIWTVQVPLDKVADFTSIAGISYIQLDEPVFPALHMARKASRVDSVHMGYNLPMAYSGKNVIMGVIDFGFDYNHPTFYDTTHSAYRVKRVWELGTNGTPPSGYSYGHELVDSGSILLQGTDNMVQSHGTCVAGIAAGSGVGSIVTSDRYRGMAYESEMVFVGVRRDSIEDQWMQSGFSDFVDGINYILTYANTVGKPAVVNISWGSQSGPHDGTSLFNQACDNLTGPGKIVVMSAGNEGQDKIHLSKTFTSTDTLLNTFVVFEPANYRRTWVDIWGDTNKTFCASVTLYHNGVAGNTTGYYCIDDLLHTHNIMAANGTDTCLVEFITATAEFNGKPRMTINIFNKGTDSVRVSVKGNDGKINAWDEYYYYGFPYRFSSEFKSLGIAGHVNGNSISTVSDMGSAQSVLLIGAYASKVNFTDINGNAWSYSGYVQNGKLAPFSSRGPMIDGRIKPDIAAPGITIASAMTSYSTSHTPTGDDSSSVISVVSGYQHPVTGNSYYYTEFLGTSASSPAAAGIVALLLQANPSLDPEQLREIIRTTAIEDAQTGNIPDAGNNNWGHGKLNAYAAIKKVLQGASGVYDFQGKRLDCVLYPNPNNGHFTLDYTSDKQETVNIDVMNVAGSKVAGQSWNVNTGNNRQQLNLAGLPKGLYIVRVSSAEGYVNIKTLVD
ncbi:MAG: S8/S53 family peptidase [Bacteroidia bacterium]